MRYQESDLDFISRLWEEGISTSSRTKRTKIHSRVYDGKARLSHASRVSPKPSATSRTCMKVSVRISRRERAAAWCYGAARLRSSSQPLIWEASAQASQFTEYKMYFSQVNIDPTIGNSIMQSFGSEELRCPKNRYVGAGSVRAMLPGYKFFAVLMVIGVRDCNQGILDRLWLEHRGTGSHGRSRKRTCKQRASYENRAECISAKFHVSSAAEYEKDPDLGVQTALVVGPTGKRDSLR